MLLLLLLLLKLLLFKLLLLLLLVFLSTALTKRRPRTGSATLGKTAAIGMVLGKSEIPYWTSKLGAPYGTSNPGARYWASKPTGPVPCTPLKPFSPFRRLTSVYITGSDAP